MASRTESTPKAGGKRAPEFASQQTGATHPLVEVRAPYILTHHPGRWAVLAGRLVPQLGKLPLVAGVERIEVERATGRIRMAAARAKLEEEGRIVIPYEWAPDGVSYLQCVATKPGRDVQETWLSVFESAHLGDGQTSTDIDAYAEWLESLVTSGKIPACQPHVIDRMLDSVRERLAVASAELAKSGGQGPIARRVELLTEQLKVLESHASKRGPKAASKKSVPVMEG